MSLNILKKKFLAKFIRDIYVNSFILHISTVNFIKYLISIVNFWYM